MDCKKVQDKLLDYVDGELNECEEIEIKSHLGKCEKCNIEYEEVKSTINYLVDNFNKIDTNKDIKLNSNIYKRKSVKRITRTGLIAVALSLIMVVTVFATDLFGFMKWWEKSSAIQMSAWEKLLENGVGQKLDISVVDENIRVTAEGVIADDLNTIILLKIEDLKGDTRFTPIRARDIRGPLVIGGDVINQYDNLLPNVNHHTLYTEDKGTVRLMVKTEPLSKNKGNIEIDINKLGNMGNYDEGIGEGEKIALDGSWNLTIPAEKLKSKSHKIDEIIDLDGNKLIIDEIVIAPTATNIRYKIKRYNKEENYFMDKITFLVNIGEEVYESGEFSFGILEAGKESGYSQGEYHIQSLYLEEPKDIDLVINTYRYTTQILKEYDIDGENLPQVIEYEDSKITIEDIIYKEDRTDIIIKEDSREDRKYIKSNIYPWKRGLQPKEDRNYRTSYGNSELEYGWVYPSNISSTEHEIRDSTGKIEENSRFWTEEMYASILEWKITLEKSQLKNFFREEFNEGLLIPDKIIIDGQEYIKYPNIKRNIKLK